MNHIRIFRQHIPAYILLFVLFEFLAMIAAVYAAHAIRFFSSELDATVYEGVDVQAQIYAIVNLICMIAMGAYRPHSSEGLIGSMLRTMVAICLIGTAVLSMAFYFFPALQLYFGRGLLAIASVLSLVFIGLLRLIFRRFIGVEALRWQVLIVGAGVRASQLLESLTQIGAGQDVHLMWCWPVVNGAMLVDAEKIIDSPESLFDYCARNKIQEIVVAVDERRRVDNGGFPLDELLDCKLHGIQVVDDLSFLERESGQLDIRKLSPGWLVFSDGFSFSPMRDVLERGFDIFASAFLLLITWPFMLLTVIAIKLEEGLRAPIIYSQERVGFGGRIIRVHKFRSMRVDAEKDGKAQWAQKNDSRVTRIGNFIRNTRIDELPQIFNVLKGEMSFVGPRPERPQFVEELAQQIPYYRERHRVKPGITGWAQLCYPYGASVHDAEQKLTYDLYYIKNHSLMFDLYILVRTVEVILLGKGVR